MAEQSSVKGCVEDGVKGVNQLAEKGELVHYIMALEYLKAALAQIESVANPPPLAKKLEFKLNEQLLELERMLQPHAL